MTTQQTILVVTISAAAILILGTGLVANFTTREDWTRWYNQIPRPIRIIAVSITGFALIAAGIVAIILPGPFTLPPIILGLVILGAEFEWALAARKKAEHTIANLTTRALKKLRIRK